MIEDGIAPEAMDASHTAERRENLVGIMIIQRRKLCREGIDVGRGRELHGGSGALARARSRDAGLRARW